MPSAPMQTLIDLASNNRVARIHYRKTISAANDQPRLVEAYNLTVGQGDPMVRVYQLSPDEGWRFFMIRKITQVDDGGSAFEPRAAVTLGDSIREPKPLDNLESLEEEPIEQDRSAHYQALVGDAMADGTVSPDEFQSIQQFISASGLTTSEMHFVHATLFHQCLGAILEDGRVDDHECAQIQFLHRVLQVLGWGVVD